MEGISTRKTARVHSLNDILTVTERLVMQVANENGEASGPPVQIKGTGRHVWMCQQCEVEFHQWEAALHHIRDMNRDSAVVATGQQVRINVTPDLEVTPVRVRVRGRRFSDEKILDIIRFAHDVLGMTISGHQAVAVAQIVSNHAMNTKIDLAVTSRALGKSQASRIAAEYLEIKGRE